MPHVANVLQGSLLLRWLYRLALAMTVLLLLLLLATGLMLNHGGGPVLGRLPVAQDWLQRHYSLPGADPASAAPGLVHHLPAGDLAVHDGQLRFNERELGECPRLVGVVEQPGQVLVACSNRLFLLSPDGELLRQADALRGIPEGLSAVSRAGSEVLLRQGNSTFSVDLGDLSVAPARSGSALSLPEAAAPATIDGERLLLDLHSGRLFGRYGPWLMDAMTLLFAGLALSGLVMAHRRGRLRS
jgi:hypothetical protein